MKKNLILICALLLAACSIRVTDMGQTATPVVRSTIAVELPTSTSLTVPTAPPTQPAIALPTHFLTGHLIYIQGIRTLVKLDLGTGRLTTLFDGTGNAWITAASVSPDGKQIVMAYAPPSQNPAQMGYAALYLMPTDGSAAPKVFVPRRNDQDTFFMPIWSANGKYVYYAHEVVNPATTQTANTYKYVLERASYPDGQTQQLIDNAFWPRPSPDGSKLAYVSFEPQSNANDLYIANADGSQPKRVLPANDFLAVDAPLFSPDGKELLFSAVGQPQVSQLSWFDQLLGVQVAEAHNIPSEWWRVSATGGKPERLTNIGETGLFGAFSPDGSRLAFITFDGIFVMAPDGSDLIQLIPNGPTSTVDWIP